MNSEFLASSWKYFHGRGLLNHTPCRRGVEMACYFEVEAMVQVSFFRNKAILRAS